MNRSIVGLLLLSSACVETALDAEGPGDARADAMPSEPCCDASSGVRDAAGDSESLIQFEQVRLPVDSRFNILSFWGGSPKDLWAVGVRGLALHWEGTAWTSVPTGTTNGLLAISGNATDILAVSTTHFVLRRGRDPAAGWQTDFVYKGYLSQLFSVWASEDSSFWTGGGWLTDPAGSEFVVDQVNVSPDGGLARRVGGRLGYSFERVRAIWGLSSEDLWAVGSYGLAYHRTTAKTGVPAWEPVQTQSESTLQAVHGSAVDNVWLVGNTGTVRHWTNQAPAPWEVVEVPTRETLNAVWSFGPNDVWVAGNAGVVLHFDGSRWTSMFVPKVTQVSVPGSTQEEGADLYAMWGSSPNDLWIGGDGVLVHTTGAP